MKAIILAAGYATRLYPLTLNTPKALLMVGKQTIMDFVIDEINTIDEIDEVIVVTNNKFYSNFTEWSNHCNSPKMITVVNDFTTDDDNKLGAIGDINYTIDKLNINSDILVMASDNIFTFNLSDFYNFYKKLNKDSILVKKLDDIEDLKRMANVVLDDKGKVLDMIEKPQNPKSNIAAFASYFYKKETLTLIKKYIKDGNNPDAPGFFPSWLCKCKDIYAYTFDGECYDIGTPESYKEIQEIFK